MAISRTQTADSTSTAATIAAATTDAATTTAATTDAATTTTATTAAATGQLTQSASSYSKTEGDTLRASSSEQPSRDVGLTESEGESTVVSTLTSEQKTTLTSISSAITSGGSGSASTQGQWANFVAELKINGTYDVNALVQQVLRESYTESTEDLEFYAQKVSFYNDLKDKIRDDLSTWRGALSDVAGADDDAVVELVSEEDPDNSSADGTEDNPYKVYVEGIKDGTDEGEEGTTTETNPLYDWSDTPEYDSEDGSLMAVKESTASVDTSDTITKDTISTHIDDLEEDLNSVGDDAQLANVDLQNMLQKQQQTLQMMSNISKMLYDTAMAVVRKISG